MRFLPQAASRGTHPLVVRDGNVGTIVEKQVHRLYMSICDAASRCVVHL